MVLLGFLHNDSRPYPMIIKCWSIFSVITGDYSDQASRLIEVIVEINWYFNVGYV